MKKFIQWAGQLSLIGERKLSTNMRYGVSLEHRIKAISDVLSESSFRCRVTSLEVTKYQFDFLMVYFFSRLGKSCSALRSLHSVKKSNFFNSNFARVLRLHPQPASRISIIFSPLPSSSLLFSHSSPPSLLKLYISASCSVHGVMVSKLPVRSLAFTCISHVKKRRQTISIFKLNSLAHGKRQKPPRRCRCPPSTFTRRADLGWRNGVTLRVSRFVQVAYGILSLHPTGAEVPRSSNSFFTVSSPSRYLDILHPLRVSSHRENPEISFGISSHRKFSREFWKTLKFHSKIQILASEILNLKSEEH